jgi:hypothetical protein
MKTNINLTISTLNGHYLTSDNKINSEYLCDAIVMWAMNNQTLYNALMNKRLKVHSVVWMTLTDLANDHLKSEGYNLQCQSYQLKQWLETYGNGYTTLAAAVEELSAERTA